MLSYTKYQPLLFVFVYFLDYCGTNVLINLQKTFKISEITNQINKVQKFEASSEVTENTLTFYLCGLNKSLYISVA